MYCFPFVLLLVSIRFKNKKGRRQAAVTCNRLSIPQRSAH